MKTFKVYIAISIALLVSCKQKTKEVNTMKSTTEKHASTMGSLKYDLDFLKEHDDNLIVLSQDSSRVIVSAKYQAKVFTSSAQAEKGLSFGWINYKAFDGPEDAHMNAYGGENRFWLGPEGNKFSLYFPPKSEMVFENWKTPSAFDTEGWDIKSKSDTQVNMTKEMSLQNYQGTQLDIRVNRSVKIFGKSQMASLLNVNLDAIKSVGYEANNSIENTGDNNWTEDTGAPCIWMLDMFNPSSQTTIVIPYNEDAPGKVVTTDYFGQIPPDRVTHKEGTLFFKADGKSRGKLGLSPKRARTVAGSYDALNKVLTITLFQVDEDATYLNQEWNTTANPLQGDAVNAYNDGPLEDGSQMGPFYEIESVSPAAFLKPGEKLSHTHSVFHLMGDEDKLDTVSQHVFGVSLQEITTAL